MRSSRRFYAGLLTGMFVVCYTAAASETNCGGLRNLNLPHASVTLAETEAAGKFVPPGGTRPENAQLYAKLPEFCRAVIRSHPTADSDIEIEIWMPASGWNGRFQGEGNGGFAGAIGYDQLAAAVSSGYASAATDTGHKADGTDAAWALNHPEKVVDFGYRAIHEMAEDAKTVMQAFYHAEPRKSYFVACSDGGREALMEAQRFPEDFDGILAGAPANYWTHLVTAGDDLGRLADQPANAISPAKIPAISNAVLQACDNLDGVNDGILTDPRRCHFQPGVLACKGADSNNCLTQPQITLLTRLYAGSKTSSGQQIFPGFLPGGEGGDGGWKGWILGDGDPAHSTGSSFVNGYFRYMVYSDPQWKPGTHSVEDDLRAAEEKTGKALDSIDPDLSPFARRGGRLIIYHGWNDPAISALNSINYYQAVNAKMGPSAASQFVRLYMVPGMQHCTGGPGPSWFGQFSILPQRDPDHSIFLSLQRWVETGAAPRTIIASKVAPKEGKVEMTRPICAYPKLPRYKGHGDTNSADNFECAAAE
jgi:hypothetical protein